MFGKSQGGDAVVVARETHEGSYRSGINVYAPTGLYHHVYDYILDVTPDEGGAVFRATSVEYFQGQSEHRPITGEKTRVKIHKNNEVELDRKALYEQAKAEQSKDHDKFAALANADPGVGTAATSDQLQPSGDPRLDMIMMRLTRAQRDGDNAAITLWQSKLDILLAGGDPASVDRQAAGAGPVAAGGADPLDRLAKLAELHKQGVLTNEEFAAEKAKILG